jgi:hypothetical protein
MKRKATVGISIFAICVVGLFLFAPVLYFESITSGFALSPVHFTVYRSLGCQLLGFGDEYIAGKAPFPSPMSGLVFTCVTPYGPNATSAAYSTQPH